LNTIDELKRRLEVLAPISIDIVDESALHAGHPGARGGGGHYRLTIVSERFCGAGRIARHRMVFDAVGDLMQGRIHALPMNALTPEEAGKPTNKESR
jgi:BolA protein